MIVVCDNDGYREICVLTCIMIMMMIMKAVMMHLH